jgi:hypothetical protein
LRITRLLYSKPMKRLFVGGGILLLLTLWAGAQTSLDAIQDDLRAAKLQHDSADSQTVTAFFNALNSASASPTAALALYQQAGGALPNAAPVQSRYDYETPTEKEQREARDAQNIQAQGALIQVHCGLMRNAARLVLTPNAPGVHDDWISWLQAVAPSYPQLVPPAAPPAAPSSDQSSEYHHHHHADDQGGNANPPPAAPAAPKATLKDVAVRDSVISSYLGFHGWGDAEQGKWAVHDLPKLYNDLVLQPLRQPVTPAVINAWNVYIAMRQTDESDQGKWSQDEEPQLEFDRDSDDFALQPTMEKLTALDEIIKANPASSHLDDWISRMQGMIDIYRGGGTTHTPLPGATPSTPSADATGATPVASPGIASSEAAGVQPVATPGGTLVNGGGALPSATPGITSSETAGVTPLATPGAASVITFTPVAGATPGAPSATTTGSVPSATPGTPIAGGGAPLPTASPGTPSSAAPGPLPAPTPGTPSSGTAAAPTATP